MKKHNQFKTFLFLSCILAISACQSEIVNVLESSEKITPLHEKIIPLQKIITSIDSRAFNTDQKLYFSTEQLIYDKNKLRTIVSNDSAVSDGKTSRWIITSELIDLSNEEFKIQIKDSRDVLPSSFRETSYKKSKTGFFSENLTVGSGPKFITQSVLNFNANNKFEKIIVENVIERTDTDNVSLKTNSVGTYFRTEYDTNGNVSKIFLKNSTDTPEYLFTEYTYDSKSNPLKIKRVFGWVWMDNVAACESNNNILTIKMYDSKGKVIRLTENLYSYNSNNLPIFVKTTYNHLDVGLIATGDTQYKY